MRFGFVGLGRAARLYHLPAVAALEGAQSVGGFDPSEQQRASWARETGIRSFADVREEIEQTLWQEKREKALEDYLDRLRAAAEIRQEAKPAK